MNSLHIFRTPFFDITAGGLLRSIIYFISHVCIHFFTCQISKVILQNIRSNVLSITPPTLSYPLSAHGEKILFQKNFVKI